MLKFTYYQQKLLSIIIIDEDEVIPKSRFAKAGRDFVLLTDYDFESLQYLYTGLDIENAVINFAKFKE